MCTTHLIRSLNEHCTCKIQIAAFFSTNYNDRVLPGCVVPSEDALTCPPVPVGIPAIVRPVPAPAPPVPPGVPDPVGRYLADFVNSAKTEQRHEQIPVNFWFPFTSCVKFLIYCCSGKLQRHKG